MGARKSKTTRPKTNRSKVPNDVALQVLIEAGYRCAVPTCRTILAIDLHHMVEVSKGGGNEPGNLLALCPTCHALHHRGEIPREAIFAWKSILVSLSQAFDVEAIDLLLFLADPTTRTSFTCDGNGVLRFARLIAGGFVGYGSAPGRMENLGLYYRVALTPKGELFLSAWKRGDRAALAGVQTSRRLTDEQKEQIVQALHGVRGSIQISNDLGAWDAKPLADDFAAAFRKANWHVDQGPLLSVRVPAPSGIAAEWPHENMDQPEPRMAVPTIRELLDQVMSAAGLRADVRERTELWHSTHAGLIVTRRQDEAP